MAVKEMTVKRFKEIMQERNMTPNALAVMSGVTPSTIKNIVNPNGGSHNPRIVTIKKICDGLEITLAEFFDTEEFNNLEQEIK